MRKGTKHESGGGIQEIGMGGGFEAARKHFGGLLEDRDEMGILRV